jgi:ribosomal protein L37AE/L43A
MLPCPDCGRIPRFWGEFERCTECGHSFADDIYEQELERKEAVGRRMRWRS